MPQEPSNAQHRLAQATLLALQAITPGSPDPRFPYYMLPPAKAPLSTTQAVMQLAALPTPVSCHSVRLLEVLGIVWWSRRDDTQWLREHEATVARDIEALKRIYDLDAEAKVLVRGGAEAIVLTLVELAQWYREYNILFATRVAARIDASAGEHHRARIAIPSHPQAGSNATFGNKTCSAESYC